MGSQGVTEAKGVTRKEGKPRGYMGSQGRKEAKGSYGVTRMASSLKLWLMADGETSSPRIKITTPSLTKT